jgi:Ala-tRNA(Pro) deacylase
MMRKLLEGHEIEYTTVQRTAGSDGPPADSPANRSGRMLAETVMLKIDGGFAMALIPVNQRLRLELLKEMVDAQSIRQAEAQELDRLFPDCDGDAIPPFGMLHGMRVFVAEALSRSQRLAFYAGSRMQVAELLYSDYSRLVRPIVAPISTAAEPHTRARPGHDESHSKARDSAPSAPAPAAISAHSSSYTREMNG